MHNYLSAGIVIEPRLDFLASTEQRTMMKDERNHDCMIMHYRCAVPAARFCRAARVCVAGHRRSTVVAAVAGEPTCFRRGR